MTKYVYIYINLLCDGSERERESCIYAFSLSLYVCMCLSVYFDLSIDYKYYKNRLIAKRSSQEVVGCCLAGGGGGLWMWSDLIVWDLDIFAIFLRNTLPTDSGCWVVKRAEPLRILGLWLWDWFEIPNTKN